VTSSLGVTLDDPPARYPMDLSLHIVGTNFYWFSLGRASSIGRGVKPKIPKEISLKEEWVPYKHKVVVRFCHLLYSLCNS
jgi:hypothetical protein